MKTYRAAIVTTKDGAEIDVFVNVYPEKSSSKKGAVKKVIPLHYKMLVDNEPEFKSDVYYSIEGLLDGVMSLTGDTPEYYSFRLDNDFIDAHLEEVNEWMGSFSFYKLERTNKT